MVDAKSKGRDRQHDGHRRHLGVGELGHRQPQLLRSRGQVAIALHGPAADADVGHQDRQQDQVGQNDHTDTHRRGDPQLADNLDFDQQQRDETHSVGNQRHDTRHIERPECTPCGGIGIVGVTVFDCHAIDDLHAVGYPDGEHQKRHQNRIRIQAEPQRAQQPQLPDDRDDRTDQCRHRTLQAAGKDQQQYEGNQQRRGKEHHHLDDAFDQITHLLGKADDMNADIRVFRLEFGAYLAFQFAGEITVIQPQQLALILGIGVELLERHLDNGRLEVVRHQTSDFTGLEHVFAQLVEILLVQVGWPIGHRAAVETVFGHFGPAHIGGP